MTQEGIVCSALFCVVFQRLKLYHPTDRVEFTVNETAASHSKHKGRPGGYATAKRKLLRLVEHRRDTWLNRWAENSREPTRERERRMRGFESPGYAQRCLSVFGIIASFFRIDPAWILQDAAYNGETSVCTHRAVARAAALTQAYSVNRSFNGGSKR